MNTNIKEKYKILELDYFYVLTVKNNFVVIDNIGYHKTQALETIDNLYTDKIYKDCFNYLLKDDRELKAWSNDNRIREFKVVIKKGDENEPAKKPRELNAPINKGEIFDWYSFTRYKIDWPTKEAIDNVRIKHWWDSKTKPLFCFYHSARPIKFDSLVFYVPKWLGKYNHSYTYRGFNVDSKPLDEGQLKTKGLEIQRFVKEDIDPTDHLKKLRLDNYASKFSYWEKLYTGIGMNMRAENFYSELEDIVITVCLLMPEEKIWRENNKLA
jgi:hypothetical protein